MLPKFMLFLDIAFLAKIFLDSGSFLASILIVFHVFGIPFFDFLFVSYFFDFPLILGPSILEMLGFTIVKPTFAESHSFSNKLKKL